MREKICEWIYNGTLNEGDMLPAERKLSETLGVSRITLRKSLDILVEQGLIEKTYRTGSQILLPNRGNPSTMDMVVLIAPSKNTFFAEFIRTFQDYGQKTSSMILYAEKPKRESLIDCIYRFWLKVIHNVVIWPEDVMIEQDRLRRLRALGMNMVFFDTDAGLPYADYVSLDNQSAAHELCTKVSGKIGYVGWVDGPKYSSSQRKQAFVDTAGNKILFQLSWKDKAIAKKSLFDFMSANRSTLPDVIFYSDQECGVMLAETLRELNLFEITLIGIDSLPNFEGLCSYVCVQNLHSTVEQIFSCLQTQSRKPYEWRAKCIW